MFPSFIITFREVIEASLILATIIGILVKINQRKSIKTVTYAALLAITLSIGLIGLGSLIGIEVQELYEKSEAYIEGILSIITALFITWAVFFLHKFFSEQHKAYLESKIKSVLDRSEQKGLFLLIFSAVFREGIEIALFLFTIYLSTDPFQILVGFLGGLTCAILLSVGLFTTALRLPITYMHKLTSILLILFAGGSLVRGIHEFTEIGILPGIREITLPLIPSSTTVIGDLFKTVFGITQQMSLLQSSVYILDHLRN